MLFGDRLMTFIGLLKSLFYKNGLLFNRFKSGFVGLGD